MFRSAALSLLSPQPSPSIPMGRIGRTVLACSALALLSACGGGDRAEPYQPDRVVVFGDENSAFADHAMGGGNSIRGLVYTVNVVGPRVSGAYTRYCTDVSVPSNACLNADFETTGGFLNNFDASIDAEPLGTGTYVAPGVDLLTSPVNAVRMVGVGDVTHVVPGALPADPLVYTHRTLKRDSIVQYVCNADVIAAQRIAHTFSKGFTDACPLETNGGAKSFATAGNKVANLQAQVNLALGQGLLGKGSLVTVWIGQNDIIEIAESPLPALDTLEEKLQEAKVRADSLAQVVKQILGTGAKVVVISVPDLAFSPWARGLASTLLCTNTSRNDGSAVNGGCNGNVQDMVEAFNSTLKLGDKDTGLKGLQDYVFRGRDYTFVDAAEVVRSYALSSSYVNEKVCADGSNAAPATVTPPASPTAPVIPSVEPDGTIALGTGRAFEVQYCTKQTLVKDGNLDTYIWADTSRLSLPVHQGIANAALVRAVNQF